MYRRNPEVKFIPIVLDSIAKNVMLGFDLYIRNKETKSYVLYKSKEMILYDKHIKTIKERFKVLYIQVSDKANYAKHVEKHLDSFINDPHIPESSKAFVIYEISEEVVKCVLDEPDKVENIQRSENLLRLTTEKIFKSSTFFYNLLNVMSFDYSTYNHSANVSTLVISFLRKLDMNDMQLGQELILGAFLHDIGKTRIDQKVLFKKEMLTSEEFEIIKGHTIKGEEIVKNILPERHIIHKIVRSHHEKLNGEGYPDGLRSESIPWYIQIVTISDVFDALTRNRCYKDRQDSFSALKIMQQEQREGFYDNNLLVSFMQMLSVVDYKGFSFPEH